LKQKKKGLFTTEALFILSPQNTFVMKVFVKDNTQHQLFESLHEFFKYSDVNHPPSTMHPNNQDQYEEIKRSTTDSWRFGDERQRSSYYNLRFHPSKGKNMCEQSVKTTMSDPNYKKLVRQALSYKKKVHFQDCGHKIDVSKAIAGEDRFFIKAKNTARPSVKIAINICGSASVGQEQFKKLAETAVPTIYALEMAGIPTEVWFSAFSSGTFKDVPFRHDQVAIRLKSAQERFNWTTFAPVFTLGSYRESIFLSWIYSEHAVSHGLGCPMGESYIKEQNNYGYTSVIGFNAVGPVDTVSSVFEKLF
jgi:hypothetical protein